MLAVAASMADQIVAQLTAWLGLLIGDADMATRFLKIVGLNIILSGDNAVVIALACRALPAKQRMWGIILGAGAAVVLRIVFTIALQYLLNWPWLQLIGGVLLLYIAIKLLLGEEADEDSIEAKGNLWGAVRTVAIADMVMSLDNVLAIAAAAGKDNTPLIIAGLAMSIPLIVAGAALITTLLHRFPILVWVGAALLGWVAGDLFLSDPVSKPVIYEMAKSYGLDAHPTEYLVQGACAAFVVIVGWMLKAAMRGQKKTA